MKIQSTQEQDLMIRAPAFPPKCVADKGKVQMGTYTPLFPAPRAE
jgi:hypothetical protein